MKTNINSKILTITAAFIILTAFAGGLYGESDIAPTHHYFYEPSANRPFSAAVNPVEFEYGISDTTFGYLVPGIEVRGLRFRKNDEEIYGSYDYFRRFVKPVAAGLYRYGLLIVLALFVIVWLAMALNKWQKPVHIANRRHSAETRHLAYLIHQRQVKRNLPDYNSLVRPSPGRKTK